MIELKDVSYSYSEEEQIVKNLNLKIQDGECILLCGRSGCGKTTIGRIINNLIPRFFENGRMKGEVYIDDKNTNQFEMYELSRLIGTVFQNPKAQFFHTNSDAEIVFGLENSGMESEEIIKSYKKAVDELNIQNLTNKNMFLMSGGEKQIIAFASIYAMNPKVYVLDEPTANIDKTTILKIREIIEKLKKEGHTIIICEHRLYFLKDLVDRVLYVDKGVIKQSFSGKDFFKLDDIKRISMGLRCLEEPTLKIETKQNISNNSLKIENVSCNYGEKKIFENLKLGVNEGEILGIIGKNGVGKTTLIRCIAGLHKQSEGQISLDGKVLNSKERQKLSAMVMQDVNYQLFTNSLVEECHLGNNCSDSQIEEVLKELGLIELKELHPMVLSGGQKQRLVIGNAVLSDKQIFIFDEPTSGLDYEGMKVVSKELKKLSKKGYYIFIVSHDIEFINATCDRVYEF
ncbi:TPA: ABC transporter ATP-binding protein [Streptococcus pyogenes]|uniref:ABC transporter ATP-binding protein n=1 Tax=Peptoniphilus harei TaxID=54005 RepID=UPI0011DDD2FE|nr:ABC transporter ATP-binding protein [Peptoniphilus harei]HAP3441595.1 ABC transporter ATP-binding protein [Enterococcus faecalis]HEQ4075199.1 ABC transporter ATP-binding protein [Streptococcus pyogenes]HES3128426.1 ABC transporter ATP-binding protein [Streptococcus pyogenes]